MAMPMSATAHGMPTPVPFSKLTAAPAVMLKMAQMMCGTVCRQMLTPASQPFAAKNRFAFPHDPTPVVKQS